MPCASRFCAICARSPRRCTLNRRGWQSPLFPRPPPAPHTHDHTPSPRPQDEAAGPESGASHADLQPGPALRLLGSRRNAHPSPDCSSRPRRSANCKSWEGERQPRRRPERSLSTRLRLPRNSAPPTRSICPAAQFVLVVCAKVEEPVLAPPPTTLK